ncbi:MAG: hypothetical protein KGL62_02295, partial [Bradyrhizobium sp.]|uniref:hypothetical protein n=1 Tax=Bradyrhizobium sp. TaxID=376 RepID=UPI00239B9C14
MRRRLIIITAAWMLLWWWPLRHFLESDMVLHMTVQIPLLIGIGLLLAPLVRGIEPPWLVD